MSGRTLLFWNVQINLHTRLADPRPENPNSKGIWQRLTIADENDVHDGGTTLAENRVALHPSSFVSPPGYPGNERKMIHHGEAKERYVPGIPTQRNAKRVRAS